MRQLQLQGVPSGGREEEVGGGGWQESRPTSGDTSRLSLAEDDLPTKIPDFLVDFPSPAAVLLSEHNYSMFPLKLKNQIFILRNVIEMYLNI